MRRLIFHNILEENACLLSQQTPLSSAGTRRSLIPQPQTVILLVLLWHITYTASIPRIESSMPRSRYPSILPEPLISLA
jgi:hypothetical protein